MSGATGAGSTGTPTGTETDGGGRGSAADAADSHEPHGPQGGTVTETRGPGTQPYATGGRAGQPAGAAGKKKGKGRPAGGAEQPAPAGSPLPGERQPQQGTGGPYHPPQAYQTPPAGAVRRPRTGATTAPRTRKARLRVSKADPWSVMKVSFLLSIALGVCTIVASAVLWMVMDAMGVFSTVGGTISEATGSNESNGFDLQAYLSLPHVLLFAAIIAVIDVVLATALATLGAFIYNLSAGFVGGIELTLAEDE
ncbi:MULTISPECIES: DUF3566 domain-containing protein [unclassified Streptomyces]|uniref:DUF3566 domain-containing protein n=1 Tax=unclassified Streptomyces TaxID=2593676 RepID=UPI0004C01E57|nr:MULTISPECIES: DUF3566 domain-containing protein [unclassified Streptomyces]